MSFAAPSFLFFLLGLLVLLWLARLSAKRRHLRVGSLLLWQRVAEHHAPERARRRDPLLLLLLAALTLAIIGAARPELAISEEAPPLLVLMDASPSGVFAGIEEAQLEGLGIAADWPRVSLGVDQRLTREMIFAAQRQHPAAHYILVSPLDLGVWPANTEQVCPAYRRESRALAHLRLVDDHLYARATRPHSRFRITSDGESREVQTNGDDLLLTLPKSASTSITVERLDAEGTPDAAALELVARPPLRLFFGGDEEQAKALTAAFGGKLVLVGKPRDADFAITDGGKKAAALRIVSDQEATQAISGNAHSLLFDVDSAFAKHLPNGWLGVLPPRAFSDQSGAPIVQVEIGDSAYTLVRRAPDGAIETTIELWGREREALWVPLFIAAAVEEVLAVNLLDAPYWQAAAGADLALAPDADTLAVGLATHISAPKPIASTRDLAWLGVMLGLLLLLGIGVRERRWLWKPREAA